MEKILNAFLSNDMMFVILGSILIGILIYLYNATNNTKSDIDVADLVMVDGKISDSKLIRLLAFVISSWGLVYLITINALSEWYFLMYMGAWVANALLSKNLSITEKAAERAAENSDDAIEKKE